MPRPPRQPRRSEFVDTGDLEAYDRAIRRETGDPVPDWYELHPYHGALLTSPLLAAITSQMGTFVRTAGDRPGTYTHAQREFVDQVLSADWKTNVVLDVHIPDAVATGVRIEAIKALRYGNEEELDDEERLLAKYIRQVVGGTVEDGTWDAMEGLMGTRGVVEYTAFILWLQWIIRMWQTLKIPGASDEEIDRLIDELSTGARDVPDYRVRIR